ncbi:unnamed protein product [Rotaria socialis]
MDRTKRCDDNGTGALEPDDSNNDLNDSEQEVVDIEYMGNNNDTDSLSEYDDTEVNVAGNKSDDNDKLSETFDSLDEEQLLFDNGDNDTDDDEFMDDWTTYVIQSDCEIVREQNMILVVLKKCRGLISMIKRSTILTLYFDAQRKRFKKALNLCYYLHAYFDPAGFTALTEIERRSVEQTIKKSVADQASHSSISVANTLSSTTTTANSASKPNANRNVKRNAMDLFNESVGDIQYEDNRENESKRAAIINEFYHYRKYVIEFNERHKPDAGSAIVFWRTYDETFSILKGIAKKMLSTPATSVPSESCFSTSSALARKERARLSGKHLCSNDIIDRICLTNSSSHIQINPSSYYSAKSIENKFNQSINILNNSIKQLLKYELNTVVNNGQLTTTSNIRHGRYYNPATSVKQMNDLKRRLHWVQQRQMIVKQYNINQDKKITETIPDVNLLENVWFEHRLKMLDNSLELLKKKETEEDEDIEDEEIVDDFSCARCRIYQRKNENNNQLLKKLKHIHQVRNEHNYSSSHTEYSTPESDLIVCLSKIADRIGHTTTSNISNSSKKVPSSLSLSSSSSSATTSKKKQQLPKLQSSVSVIVGDTNKTTKRTIEESRNISNSNFISTNYDLTNKRQKRIASPQSSLSTTSNSTTGITNTSSAHDILTPSWRILTNKDFDSLINIEQSVSQQESEDISDESYIHRHIRCELEQESWITNDPILKTVSLTSNRKNGTLQTSLSVPNGLSITNQKQYKYRLTPNGIAYTETIDTK